MLISLSGFYEISDSNKDLNLYELANIENISDGDTLSIISKVFGKLLRNESIIIDQKIVLETFKLYKVILHDLNKIHQHMIHTIIKNISSISNRSITTKNDNLDLIIELVMIVFPGIIACIRSLPSDHEDIYLFIMILDGMLTCGIDMKIYEQKSFNLYRISKK